MTQGAIDISLSLIGGRGSKDIYPQSVAWVTPYNSNITVSFVSLIAPSYYFEQNNFGLIEAGLNVNRDGVIVDTSSDEKSYIAVATIGNQFSIGFNEFTNSTVSIESDSGGDITIGKVDYVGTNGGGFTLSVGSELGSIWSNQLLDVYDQQMAGDIWIFKNGNTYNTYVHELGHALGLNHAFDDIAKTVRQQLGLPAATPTPFETQKFSIMAYAPHAAEGGEVTEWQLHDISALQFLYGASSYNKTDHYVEFAHGNGTDRIFSIWDGSGSDMIDASGYAQSSYIDLRPGHFSSIGPNALSDNNYTTVDGKKVEFDAGKINDNYSVRLGTDGNLGRENVSIAFGTYIEDATGSTKNDVIVGNMLTNMISAGLGNDLVFGDGFAIGTANRIVRAITGHSTGFAADLPDLATQSIFSPIRDADYRRIDQNVGAAESTDLTIKPFVDDRAKQADSLDGGAGNDLVVAANGTGATTIGGLGRDIVVNFGSKGIVWGDVQNSYALAAGQALDNVRLSDGTLREHYAAVAGDRGVNTTITDPTGQVRTVFQIVSDDTSNADVFWYAPDVTIKDAQIHDVLRYGGIALTGGDAAATGIGLLAGLGVGLAGGAGIGFQVASGTIGAANIAAWATGNSVYFDHLVPWITYSKEKNSSGGYDLLITDRLSDLWAGVFPGSRPAGSTGKMRVEHFDFRSSVWGYEQLGLRGSLGMVFKDGNALLGVAQLIAALPPIAGSGAIGAIIQAAAIVDAVITVGAAFGREAKALRWVDGGDPLVIDLNGNGLETIGANDSGAYFDIDGDLFRMRTGWLSGGDGFLVSDANGNGRIDDISELFGNRFQGGYAELAGWDSNHDGKITSADARWALLGVWRDANRDGETQAGELTTLDELGIVELSLNASALDAQTSDGARLNAYGDVRFASGAVTSMYEAVFAASASDTRYRGEAGRASWSTSTLDLKGFGSVTDLSTATANDFDLAALVASRAAAMSVPDLQTLVGQVGDVLGAWGENVVART